MDSGRSQGESASGNHLVRPLTATPEVGRQPQPRLLSPCDRVLARRGGSGRFCPRRSRRSIDPQGEILKARGRRLPQASLTPSVGALGWPAASLLATPVKPRYDVENKGCRRH